MSSAGRRIAYRTLGAWLLSLDPDDRQDITIKVTSGTPQWEIGRLAHIHNCDLIVLGKHQYKGGHDLLIGSTMEGLARSGNCSLLVADGKLPGAYEKIVLGIDMSIFARFAVRMTMSIAPQAYFTGMHVLPPAPAQDGDTTGMEPASGPEAADIEAAHAALADFMADTLGKSLPPEQQQMVIPRMELTVRTGDPYAMLCAEARKKGADLLVIGTRGRLGLPHTRLGSTATKLLNEPPCDVLAVNSW